MAEPPICKICEPSKLFFFQPPFSVLKNPSKCLRNATHYRLGRNICSFSAASVTKMLITNESARRRGTNLLHKFSGIQISQSHDSSQTNSPVLWTFCFLKQNQEWSGASCWSMEWNRVPLIGGRWYIISQLAIYTYWYILILPIGWLLTGFAISSPEKFP